MRRLAADAEVDADRWQVATGYVMSQDDRDRYVESIIIRRLSRYVAERDRLP